MKARKIFFPKTRIAEVREFELDEDVGDYELLVETMYSIISAGTESANFTNKDLEKFDEKSWLRNPGYGNVGRVIAVGKKVEDYEEGDIIFSTERHCSHYKIDTRYNFKRYALFMLKLPNGLDPLKAVFARMADVAMSAVRKAELSLGDTVLVVGLGLVGNFAAQLFQLAGADVMGAEIVDFRLQRAKQCGIRRTVNSRKWDDLKKTVMDWTDGKGAQIVVEAIGFSPVIAQAVQLTRSFGEVILLGTPRGKAVMDVTPVFQTIHLKHITVKGAFEWLWSVTEEPFYYPCRHTKLNNMKQIFSLLKSGALVTEPLLTHIFPPERCQEAYDGLAGGITGTLRTTYLGVVFDWR